MDLLGGGEVFDIAIISKPDGCAYLPKRIEWIKKVLGEESEMCAMPPACNCGKTTSDTPGLFDFTLWNLFVTTGSVREELLSSVTKS